MTATIYFQGNPVELPGATSVKYAAKRVAELGGIDPYDFDLGLMLPDGMRIPEDDVIADYDGCRLVLTVRTRRSD